MYAAYSADRENMAPTYKLVYFSSKGRAESARLIFAAAGKKYTDERLDQDQWKARKEGTPYKMLPVLDVDGKLLGESCAICRYLAKQFGMAGKNDFETALVDAAAEVITEMREKIIPVFFEKDEAAKAEKMKKYKEETLPGILTKLENCLKNNNSGKDFLVGNKLSWADTHLVAVLDPISGMVPDALKEYPLLTALDKKVRELPKIAEWLKNRPVTEM